VGVVLPEEYERLIEALEDTDDARLYDETKAAQARGKSEVIPLERAMREVREGKVPQD
jgi:uncharacterized membrane protein YkoI